MEIKASIVTQKRATPLLGILPHPPIITPPAEQKASPCHRAVDTGVSQSKKKKEKKNGHSQQNMTMNRDATYRQNQPRPRKTQPMTLIKEEVDLQDQSKTSGDDGTQETARNGVVESSRVRDSGLGRDGGGSVGSVGGVLGSSGGHKGSDSEGDEIELHCDLIGSVGGCFCWGM